jgi:hypothetical protein
MGGQEKTKIRKDVLRKKPARITRLVEEKAEL